MVCCGSLAVLRQDAFILADWRKPAGMESDVTFVDDEVFIDWLEVSVLREEPALPHRRADAI